MPTRNDASLGGFAFRVERRSSECAARSATLSTPHGEVPTPAFMPVGTRGSVKGIFAHDLLRAGARMILGNTYHLHLRPGSDTVAALGGLHRFMNWDGPILTDSGGFQVFSLGHINQIDEDGVTFQSIVDGSPVRFTPERVIDIQTELAADVIMAFDDCPPDPSDRERVSAACERTHRWLERCVARHREKGGLEGGQALFGIVQGGAFEDLRRASVEAVCSHDLVGYAIGGVRVGEERQHTLAAIDAAAPLLPEDRPRYLMGVGTPADFFDAVERGIDLFDCVTPTRHARNHQAFTSQGRINLRNQGWRQDLSPLDPECACLACTGYSRGILRHLCSSQEMLGPMLLTLHNLTFFHDLLAKMSRAIAEGGFYSLRDRYVANMTRKLLPQS